MRFLWRIVEFLSLLPVLSARSLAQKALDYVIGEGGLLGIITWALITLKATGSPEALS